MNNKLKKYFSFAVLALTAVMAQSCLDYDTPGDEFNANTEVLPEVVLTFGKADSIPYNSTVDEATFNSLVRSRSFRRMLTLAQGAEYYMLGGGGGRYPYTHNYQFVYSLGPDNYAQYHVVPHTYFPYSGIDLTSTYKLDRKAYGGPMGTFSNARKQIVDFLSNPMCDTIPEIKAVYLLLYNYASIDVADLFGPFPYTDYKNNKQENPFTYDDLPTIYKTAEANIDTILVALKHYDTKEQWYKDRIQSILDERFKYNDVANGISGFETWKRFANSLKLRMAMHIVKVEPETAKRWAEEAVADGVIDEIKYEVSFNNARNANPHPLANGGDGGIMLEWNDARLCASFESLLKSLNHPYINHLFAPNSLAIENSKTNEVLAAGQKVVGIRAGAHVGRDKGAEENPYINFSTIYRDKMVNAPIYLFKLSEVDFLRAEGALRGWNMGGTAQFFYERGIRNASLEDRVNKTTDYNGQNYYDALVDDYMQLENAIDYTYVDPTGKDENMPSVTKIGVKWNDGDSKEVKLEKIITQKYIALYPNSHEAWTEMRRTGYPKTFPVLHPEEGDGSLRYGDMMRRIPFPGTSDAGTEADVKATGLKALGGPDQQATRLWWDVADKDNGL